MPRICTICEHPQRIAIDKAIVSGQSCSRIAALFRVSEDSAQRHKPHLAKAVVKAAEAREEKGALDVLHQLKDINDAALGVLKIARDDGDGELQLKAIDRVQKQIELQAKLLGELDESPTVNITINPQWIELRAVIVQALEPFPDARHAVAKVLCEGGQ
jgi:hypothetical protein